MTEHTDYSEDVWAKDASYARWHRMMAHDWGNPSRYLAYYLIADQIWHRKAKFSVAEIGFGDCCDFRWFFRFLQDTGKISYVGYEIMREFVRHARDDYFLNEQSFQYGGFKDLEPKSYDVTYTRHTLEHIHPDLWQGCFTQMLEATKEVCVLTFYMPPGPGRAMERNWTGEGWQNVYDEGKVKEIIDEAGFENEVWEVGTNEVWRMERQE